MKDGFVQIGTLRLHYLEHPGVGPPLILMPGLAGNAHAFDGLVQAGLSPRLRVLALDLRGRGLSDKPRTGYSLAEHAADVIGLLDALELEQVVLGGHSFGGLLTFYLAAHYPQRIARLVIMDAAAQFHPETRTLLKPALERLSKVLPSWEAYLQEMRRMPFLNGWWDPVIEEFYRADVQVNADGTVQARTRAQTIEEVIGHVIAEPWERHLRAVSQPALLLNATGAYGPPGAPPLLPAEQARLTAATLADCRYAEVPGNHMTMLFGSGARCMVEAITRFVLPVP